MFWARHIEAVDRPKEKTMTILTVEWKLHHLVTVTPGTVVISKLKAPKVWGAGTEKHACCALLDGHLRGDDVGCPFDPVPAWDLYEVGGAIGPVPFAIAVPGVVAKNGIFEYEQCGCGPGREGGEAIGIGFPATPAIGVGPCFHLAGFRVRCH